jgi:MFS transporter, PPP family, 3-phenylpropionic acid transporter
MDRAGYEPTTVGAMWAVRSLLGAVVPIPWGLLADRLGSARSLVMAFYLVGIALLLWLSSSPSPTTCVVIFALYGAFSQPAGSMMDGMTLTALGPQRQAQFGRWRAVGTIGFGLSTIIATVLLEWGWLQPSPSSLLPCCAVFLAAAATAMWTVPPIPRPPWTDVSLLWPSLRQPMLWGLIAVGALLWASHAAFASFLAPLTSRVGLSTSVIGFTIAVVAAVEAAAMMASSQLLKVLGAKTIIVGAALLATIRWLLTSTIEDAAWFVIIQASHGLTFGLFFVVVVGLVAQRVPVELRQASQGLFSSMAFGLGGFGGSLLCGQAMAADLTDASLTWRMMAVLSSLALVAAGMLARRL